MPYPYNSPGNYLPPPTYKLNSHTRPPVTSPTPAQSAQLLTGQHCRLEPLDLDKHGDDLYHAFAPDMHTRFTFLGYGPFHDIESFKHGIAAGVDGTMMYAVISLRSNTACGYVGYDGDRTVPSNGNTEIGHVFFSTAISHTPTVTETMYLLLSYAFDTMQYRRCDWMCNCMNRKSYQAALRYGFSYEGIWLNDRVQKQQSRNTAYFSITDDEWPYVKAEYQRYLQPSNFDGDRHKVRLDGYGSNPRNANNQIAEKDYYTLHVANTIAGRPPPAAPSVSASDFTGTDVPYIPIATYTLADDTRPLEPVPSTVSNSKLMTGQYCKLVPLNADAHAQQLYDVFTDNMATRFANMMYGPYDDAAALRASIVELLTNVNNPLFAVTVNGSAVGFLGLRSVVPHHGTCMVGHVNFSTALSGTPAAAEAVYLLIRYIVQMRYRRIVWGCYSDAVQSYNAALRYGFAYESTYKKFHVNKGESRNVTWFAITDYEWPAVKAEYDRYLQPSNFDGTKHKTRLNGYGANPRNADNGITERDHLKRNTQLHTAALSFAPSAPYILPATYKLKDQPETVNRSAVDVNHDELLTGRYCKLEPLQPLKHTQQLFDAFQPTMSTQFDHLTYGPFETAKSMQQFFCEIMAQTGEGLTSLFAVVVNEVAVGFLGVSYIVPDSGVLEEVHVNYSVHLSRTPAAAEAVFLLVRYAVALKYRRVVWALYTGAVQSYHAALRYGFAYEGITLNAYVTKRRSKDVAWFSVTDDEWPAVKAEYERYLQPANFKGSQQITRLNGYRANARNKFSTDEKQHYTTYVAAKSSTSVVLPSIGAPADPFIAMASYKLEIEPTRLNSANVTSSTQLLTGQHCTLVPLQADKQMMAQLFDASKEHTAIQFAGLPGAPIDTVEKLSNILNNIAVRDSKRCMFAVILNGSAVGFIGLCHTEPQDGTLEIANVNFSPLMAGTAAAAEAVYLLMRYAIALRYRRVSWTCDSTNVKSYHAALRYGFAFELVHKYYNISNGVSCDRAVFSMIDTEWLAVSAEFERYLQPGNFEQNRQLTRLNGYTANQRNANSNVAEKDHHSTFILAER